MRKIHLLLLIIWTLLFSACKDKAFKEFESGDYILGYSVIIDNSYTIGNREFVIPELPCGLYLYFDSADDSSYFPVLDYQGRFEDVSFYPVYGIKRIFENEDCLEIETINGFFSINLSSVNEAKRIDKSDGILLYDFSSIKEKAVSKYVSDIFGIQSKQLLRKYNVDFATPLINGIVWAGKTSEDVYFGKTIYSYFAIQRSEIIYFHNEQEFNLFCKENIKDKSLILSSKYMYR